MSEQHTSNGRRRFLKTAALASGAATVAVAGGAVVADTATPEPAAKPGDTPTSKGYHVTPHIEAYYRLARS